MVTRRFKTNLRCGACVAAVKPLLDAEPAISRWDIDVESADKDLTVSGNTIDRDKVNAALNKAGYEIVGDVESPTEAATQVADVKPATYYPLILLLAFLLLIVGIVELRAGSFQAMRAMSHFMGAFFLAFAFFKLLDLRGFATTYRMYDVVAARVPIYGYLYPFIELALGISFVAAWQPLITNIATLIVMSISIVGVIQTLVNKRKIRCACLGTVFNLPMSTVTLVEDGSMIVMSAIALIGMI
jgi:copper chaperone CopZ